MTCSKGPEPDLIPGCCRYVASALTIQPPGRSLILIPLFDFLVQYTSVTIFQDASCYSFMFTVAVKIGLLCKIGLLICGLICKTSTSNSINLVTANSNLGLPIIFVPYWPIFSQFLHITGSFSIDPHLASVNHNTVQPQYLLF